MALPLPVLGPGYEEVLRPVMFASFGGDPEKVHEWMIDALRLVGGRPALRGLLKLLAGSAGSPCEVAGIQFPGRVGLAAGMDKDGVAAKAWSALGFGFAELGTVTALPQPGNPRPRVFRAVASQGLVNRMGFNNHGAAALANTLRLAGIYRGNGVAGIPLGVSLGKSKAVPLPDAVADYLAAFDHIAPHADYIAVNVSSPNTPGLRELQDADSLHQLLRALVSRAGQDTGAAMPILVKLAPDLSEAALTQAVEVAVSAGAGGLIVTNTTLARDGLADSDSRLQSEAGGLSGAPLRTRSLAAVKRVRSLTGLPIIGSGGVMSQADAAAMFDAGADLIQLYTGFIYRGPALIAQINQQTSRRTQ